MNLIESFKVLKGFPMAKFQVIKSDSEIGESAMPCFLKVADSIHKTEKNAVLKCKNIKEAKENFKILRKDFPKSEIVMQEEVDGIEMILGLKEDRVFGKMLLIGFGGIFTETIKDVSFRAIPVNKKEIEKMIYELKMSKILNSRKKYAIDKFIDLAEKVQKLNVKEMDLNPVIVNEKEAVIVDSRILI